MRTKMKKLRTAEIRNKIIDFYYRDLLPLQKVCEKLNLSRGTLYNIMQEFGLPMREGVRKVQTSPECKCKNKNTKIIRIRYSGSDIIRERWCPKCGRIIITKEQIIGERGTIDDKVASISANE